jgi:PTS system mannitol-specific IIC component
MVMPNIGAFIAWGLVTALFIEAGWWPVPALGGYGVDPATCAAEILNPSGETVTLPNGQQACSPYGGIVGPMITYMLPILIGAAGGRMVYGVRGGVVGAIATVGVIAGTDIPMFMGAMIMGPLGGWSMKHIDSLWHGKIKPGFEMLVDNFSAGIWAAILAVFGFYVMGPIVTVLSNAAGAVVDFLVVRNLLPLTSILIEPAKVLFLNNAINHGILTPLGTQEALETGKSILFLLETNPGPGLGLLLAYSVFGRGVAKASAPGAAIIQSLGGIHEVYFPFVLMRPVLICATILGGMTGIFINVIFGVGLRAPAAPGSIFAIYAQTAPGGYLGVTLSMIGAATVSFLVASFFLKTAPAEDEGDLAAATESMESMKGKKSSVASALTGGAADSGAVHHGPIKSIVFACDAGMGSSAMGASVLRKKVHEAGFTDVTVVNQAISNLTDTNDLVVTHRDLTARAQQRSGSAVHVSVDNFMGSPRYDEIVELLRKTNTEDGAGGDGNGAAGAAAPVAAAEAADEAAPSTGDLLRDEAVVLRGSASTWDEAITEAGELLLGVGAVDPAYIEAMHEREKSVSTYVGNLLAIPHGTNEAKASIRRTAISFVRYPDGIDWKGKQVKFVIGIAGTGNDHLALLAKIAEVFLDKNKVAELEVAPTVDEVTRILGGVSVS